VVEVSEGIPFIELTDWDHERLSELKGDIVSRGVRAHTGFEMPVFMKRRFQQGALAEGGLAERMPENPAAYRSLFQSIFDDAVATEAD
jgi:asparagine synthase (glutamine-hydrolysing)